MTYHRTDRPATESGDAKLMTNLQQSSKKILKQSLTVKSQNSKVTHKSLGKQFVEIGRNIRSLSGRSRSTKQHKITLKPGPKYALGRVRRLLLDPAKVNAKRKFGGTYRGIQAEQDELVSTSSVRDLITGVLKRGTLSQNEQKEMETVFEEMSKLRFPTKWTGFALKNKVMQHPTAKGSGWFADSSQTMKAHNELDLERRNEVVQAMLDALKEKNASPMSVANAGKRAALAFSLNEFIAPATASDVTPFALAKSKTQKELKEQVVARENLKAIFIELGGKQDQGRAELNRKWSLRKGKRSASPQRLSKSTPESQLAPSLK
ncbi:hypothetical protein [Stigmatella hybrida]|uniref:hypothetical protein n=1 Tax=Stigmatella hybrida TaxID=394097 RepID=UPI001CDACB7F|nr:hypothetical protein [Stigmatella hybrida]